MMVVPSRSWSIRRRWAGWVALVLAATSMGLLTTCELVRTTRLSHPLELFLLSPQRTAAATVPYTDPTGAVTGYLAPAPGMTIDRVQDASFESRATTVLSQGRVSGKRTRHFARFRLLRRDQKRLEAFTTPGVGSVLLVGMEGRMLFTEFLTAPLAGPELVLSGPDDPETAAAIRIIQASLPRSSAPWGDK